MCAPTTITSPVFRTPNGFRRWVTIDGFSSRKTRIRTANQTLPPYYLYIDEVGRYATRTLADVMYYKRTSNIKLTMAHQDMGQIHNEEVRKAVLNCPTKVMFYVENEDRTKMVRQMYGGAVPIEAASYALSESPRWRMEMTNALS